jgi:hypothetical protein
MSAPGRLLPVVTGRYGSVAALGERPKTTRIAAAAIDRSRPRLCKNAGSALKSALLLKIFRSLVSQQTWSLRRYATFVPIQTIKPA